MRVGWYEHNETAINASLPLKFYQPHCSGTILTPYHILTAYHCIGTAYHFDSDIHNINITWVYVYKASKFPQVSEGTEKDDGLFRLIDDIIEPSWNNLTIEFMEWNIAILTLFEPIKFNDYARPACLPEPFNRTERFNGSTKFVANGWGETGFQNSSSKTDVLQQITLDYVSLENCIEAYNEFYQRNDTIELSLSTICAGGNNKSALSCEDGGGKAVGT